ncbi:flagellar basal body-associated protein FliL [Amycolatopsis vastitatis]|uniref:Flagellar basal body-associated protein FliL n=1 Tax=Amycolatopsis vastitatis TaxID=1905142 RepID=A0A229TJZ2_9PSEU|nr:flagellar basal body-associated protein FliL [Amycolatopsis vastitatis]OXM71244.1 flagellar basal body-associated protein FliL [Amycolatopsis vastitatis]
MTWQEELRRLDEELAAGNLTADEYRARRDRVLSMAVSTGDQSQAPAQPAQQQVPSTAADTQIIAPVSPPDHQANAAEATQVVSAADAAGAERTQAVPPWQQQQQHPNSPSGGFPQPMQQQQPPPPYGQHSPAGGFAQPMPQQNPWGAPQQPQQDVSPPWGGSEFPPLAPPSNNADWISQGPESFQTQPSSGKGKKIAFAVVAFLVVAGLGFGVWALFIKDGGSPTPPVAQSSSPQPPPAPTVKPLPEPPAAKPEPGDNSSALVTPAGTTRAGGGEFDMDKLQSAKYLPTTVVEKLKQSGMTEGLLKTTKDGDVTLGLFALELPNAQAASAVAAEYGNAEQEGGLTVNRNLSLHGVPVFSAADSSQQVYRAVYVLYNRVVIIDSFGPQKDATLSSFKTLLTAQVQKSPPTERTNN